MHPRAIAALVALLIGGALLWIIAADSGDTRSERRVTSAQEKEAVKMEKRLAKDPTNEALLVSATEAWIGAGADRLSEIDAFTKPIPVPEGVREDYEAGLRIWNDYLEQSDGKASVGLGEMVASTFFQLVEIGSTDPSKATANAEGAVKAQLIVCEREPSLFTLSNLATYQYFNGEYAAGDRSTRRAAMDEKSKRNSVYRQLKGYKERGEKFVGRVKRGFETLEETGEEELETPIKGYGAAAGLNGYEPGTGPGSA